jgi:peptidoglycan/LPS O-acetylase OafA/YrhL
MHILPQKLTHFRGLDSLRGLAIFAVIIYHNFPEGENLFGWLGVDLFFVLSGFLITQILLLSVDADRPGQYISKFLARRILRIFPLYYLTLLIFLYLLPAIHIGIKDSIDYIENRWAFLLFVQNWYLIIAFPKHSSYLNHFWSLAVEEQFYLIWPIIIYLVRNNKTLIKLIITLIITLFIIRITVWYIPISQFNYTNFYTFTRIDGLLVGSLLGIMIANNDVVLENKKGVIALVLAILNFLFYYFNNKFSIPYLAFVGYITFSSLFAILVYEIIQPNRAKFWSLIDNLPLRFLGKISYGLYIMHLPIHHFLHPLIENSIVNMFHSASFFIVKLTSSILTTIISVILSTLSYYYFESYFLRLKKFFY